MIAMIPVVFIIQLYISNWKIEPKNMLFWSVVANLFAVLEHINNYIRQLMIDNMSDLNYVLRNKKLKIASLAKDLSDNEI